MGGCWDLWGFRGFNEYSSRDVNSMAFFWTIEAEGQVALAFIQYRHKMAAKMADTTAAKQEKDNPGAEENRGSKENCGIRCHSVTRIFNFYRLSQLYTAITSS